MTAVQVLENDVVFGTIDQWNGGGDFEDDSYDGPTGTYLLEFVDMAKPFYNKPEYQNDKVRADGQIGDRQRAPFTFEIVGNAMGDPDPDWGRTDDDPGQKVKVFYNISLNERSSMRPMADAMYGPEGVPAIDPETGKAPILSKAKMIGRRAFGTITANTDAATGKRYAKIVGWAPYAPVTLSPPSPRSRRKATEEIPATETPDDVPF